MLTSEERQAMRTEAGAKIDPNTALVMWCYGQVLDPYGEFDLAPEERCVGRQYFARSPEADSIWVHFDDLPPQTRKALDRGNSSMMTTFRCGTWVMTERRVVAFEGPRPRIAAERVE